MNWSGFSVGCGGSAASPGSGRPSCCRRASRGGPTTPGSNEPFGLRVTWQDVSTPHLARDLSLYLVARLGLIVVVAGLLVVVNVPLLVAFAVAIVVALP